MTLGNDEAARIAEAFFAAAATRAPLAPLSESRPGLALADAYRAQAALVALKRARGETSCGYKVGSTSRAAQVRFKTAEPVCGRLFAEMRIPSGGRIESARLIDPKVECEVAVRMGADLTGPGATPAAAAAATGAVMGAFEIIDARTRDWKIGAVELIADNAVNAGFVLGRERPLDGLDLARIEATFARNDEPATKASPAAALGGPLNVVAWLANWLAARGEVLTAGTVVLTGSIGEILPARKGDRFAAAFGPLGEVSVGFA